MPTAICPVCGGIEGGVTNAFLVSKASAELASMTGRSCFCGVPYAQFRSFRENYEDKAEAFLTTYFTGLRRSEIRQELMKMPRREHLRIYTAKILDYFEFLSEKADEIREREKEGKARLMEKLQIEEKPQKEGSDFEADSKQKTTSLIVPKGKGMTFDRMLTDSKEPY